MIYQNSSTCNSFFKKSGPTPASFCLFSFFSNKTLQKKCRLQRDSNSDRLSIRQAGWPLDHHHRPSTCNCYKKKGEKPSKITAVSYWDKSSPPETYLSNDSLQSMTILPSNWMSERRVRLHWWPYYVTAHCVALHCQLLKRIQYLNVFKN